MSTFARTDTSLIGRWWWTVDRWTLSAIIAIAAIGAVLTLAASPAVAERIGLDNYHFVRRQFVFLPLALTLMIGVSLMSARGIRRLAVVLGGVAFIAMLATLLVGDELWVYYGGADRSIGQASCAMDEAMAFLREG